MMLRPDDFEKLLLIARVFLIMGIMTYAMKCGVAAYHMVETRAY